VGALAHAHALRAQLRAPQTVALLSAAALAAATQKMVMMHKQAMCVLLVS
jgi:hypothetical protein